MMLRACLLLMCGWCAWLVLPCGVTTARAQGPGLRGTVVDVTTSRPIPGVRVMMQETDRLVVTDSAGEFRLEHLDPGEYTMSFRHVGFAAHELRLNHTAEEGTKLQVNLWPVVFQSPEVVIRSTRTSTMEVQAPYPVHSVPAGGTFAPTHVTAADALEHVPGLALVRDGVWATAFSIRGMSRSNVVTLIDNIRMETSQDIAGPLSLLNMNDLERTEILKAPSSTLYGSGATGGVVNFISKRPRFTERPEMHAAFLGSFATVNDGATQFLEIEHTSERIGLRLSGGHRKAGSTMTPHGFLPNSQYHDFTISGSVGIVTLGPQSVFLTYQRAQAEDTGIPGGDPFSDSAVATYTLARRELFGLEYRFPNLSTWLPLLTVRGSRQDITRNVAIVQSPVLTLTPHAVHRTTSVQAEARLFPLADVLTVIGVDAWQRELESLRERRNSSTRQIVGERPIPESRFQNAGISLQNEWGLLPDRLRLTGGVRMDWIHVSNEPVWTPEYILRDGVMQTSPAGQRLLWSSRLADNVSWNANLGIWIAVTPTIDITAFTATSFRSPSLEERYEFIDLGNLVRMGDPDLRPEKSSSVNAGLQYHTEERHVRLDAFLNSLTDLVTDVPGTFEGRDALVKKNIGKARLYGYEVTVHQMLARWLSGTASASYVRGEDRLAGGNLPMIPPLRGHCEFRGLLNGAGTVTLGISWAGARNQTAGGEEPTPGYALLHLGFVSEPMPLGPARLSVRADVRNLTNAAYRNPLSTLRGMVRHEPGRNVVLTAGLAL
ncbi:MAG: TonB-dependent receptor [Bacteroidetes bacterium]|nr:TonB-dependent receptor [Bacteroidota bacterium]